VKPEMMRELIIYHKPTDTIVEGYPENRSVTLFGSGIVRDVITYRLFHPEFNVLSTLSIVNGKLSENSYFVILGKI